MTRAAQTGTANTNRSLATSGSGSASYAFPAATTVGTATNSGSLNLTNSGTYTEDLKFTVSSSNTLYITNTFYSGPSTSGTLLSEIDGETGTTPLAAAFDAFAIGWRATASGPATAVDISSIQVLGQTTAVTTPPSIDCQPTAASVPNGGSCDFAVCASGFNLSYHWRRYGTNLVNGGNISGATSPMLVLSPLSSADTPSG